MIGLFDGQVYSVSYENGFSFHPTSLFFRIFVAETILLTSKESVAWCCAACLGSNFVVGAPHLPTYPWVINNDEWLYPIEKKIPVSTNQLWPVNLPPSHIPPRNKALWSGLTNHWFSLLISTGCFHSLLVTSFVHAGMRLFNCSWNS